ncbi:uncharacterized protein LOC116204936 [Punica granatum]|uniref:Uncharacterized protein LOC116204936 n=1 Tax=Punica granatum TaxID=22663 RepID=A0A6P8D959_PUNGR|nr:uncharacterized protein LOC116204936 [Punica granatum]
MITACLQPPSWKIPAIAVPSASSPSSLSFLLNPPSNRFREPRELSFFGGFRYPPGGGRRRGGGGGVVRNSLFPVDPWAPNIDSESIASQLFAFSLFPYLGFLYFITKSKSAPKLTLFGFYFLLAFVGATIPAGIYAKVQYGTSLSNVDWLHGGAESLLTLTNLFIVLGLRGAIRRAQATKKSTSDATNKVLTEEQSSV